MSTMRGRLFLWVLAGIVFLAQFFLSSTAYTQKEQDRPELLQEIKHDISPPLRDIQPLVRPPGPPEAHEIRLLHAPHEVVQVAADPVLQSSTLPSVATTAGLNFDGIAANGSAPPDPNGSVGATQFVEWVNTEFAVYDKKTGNLIMGPVQGNTLWSGFGGPCQNNNDGDPIVLYDKLNNRWIFSQLSVSGAPPFYQCVAVSTSSDATGSFARYAFQQPGLNDYAKLGVWPDAYYVTYNLFDNTGTFFQGARLCAMDSAAMRAGNPATQQCFQLSSNFGGLLPSDVDGTTPPPAGEPAFFLSFDVNSLNLWQFHVDFSTPGNTRLTGPTNLPVGSFSEACGGGACIPQAGTNQQLDSLADRLMYRLAYRNFGDHESLVVNHSIVAGSSVGVRWYEIQSPASNPVVFQQGTFAPDSSYRWMGSIAMDKSGDMALGYSVSSSSLHPAIRYTGRVPGDPLGTMETETSIIEGPGSQNGGLNRWGDYTSMSVDPSDDCTFWYTNEYEPANGSFNWHTRIASFKLSGCGGQPTPDFSISASPGSQTVVQGSGTSYTVNVGALNGFTGTVNLSAGSLPSGVGATFNPASVSASGSSTMSVTTSGSTPPGTYTIAITGTSGSTSHSTSVTLAVNAANLPDFSIAASPGSRTVVQGSGTTYTATVTPLNGFTSTVNFTTGGLPSGANASFTPASVSGSGSSTMSVTTSTSTPPGTYTITITGASGSTSHSTSVTLVVNDFSISASPGSQTVVQGSGTNYNVSVTALNGFTGTVSLSAGSLPSGVGASFTPASVTGSGSSTMSVTTSSSTTPGTYTITITGASGSTSHSTSVTLVVNLVNPPDFSISASPGSQTVVQGTSTSYTVTVAALNGFSGAISFRMGSLPSGVGASFNPTSVSGSGSSTMSVTTTGSTTPGTYTIAITGTSGSAIHSTNVTLMVNSVSTPDFLISASPNSQTVGRPGTTSYTVTVTALNGFNGTVNFSVSGLPSRTTATFNPTSVTGSGTSKLTITTRSRTPRGTFTLKITGTSGSLVHSTNITLTVHRNVQSNVGDRFGHLQPDDHDALKNADGHVYAENGGH